MAKVFIEETTLTAIGDAIRSKTGKTELIDPLNMGTEIESIEAGSGGGDSGIPEEAFTITGNCQYRFAHGGWDWFVDLYGDKITTADMTNCTSMFAFYKGEHIPFTLNVKKNYQFDSCFNNAINLIECPKIRGALDLSSATVLIGADFINKCEKIRDFEDLFDPSMLDGWSLIKVTNAYSVPKGPKFGSCKSMRKVPSWWYKLRLNPESTAFPTPTYWHSTSAFSYCNTLDEITNIPVWICKAPATSNLFSAFATGCNRIKDLTFETNEGQPIVANWKAQVIDLSKEIGYFSMGGKPLTESGITSDKGVSVVGGVTDTHRAKYNEVKNDLDWYTDSPYFSRYNHDSAVETINSLPDTSEYLASAGGTNTIKFNGAAGSNTDGGAINTLTAEEIAVATAKGWTVTLV